MSDLRFHKVTPRQTHLKTAASLLASGLGASPTGTSSYKLTFYKLGDHEGRFPTHSVELPKQIAEMLSRPGGLQYLKIEGLGVKESTSQSFSIIKMPPGPHPF